MPTPAHVQQVLGCIHRVWVPCSSLPESDRLLEKEIVIGERKEDKDPSSEELDAIHTGQQERRPMSSFENPFSSR